MTFNRKTSLLALALLVGVIGIFYVATIRKGHVWGDDHSGYIGHAKNITTGKNYGDTGYVRSPTTINPKMYPPVFPLLLAPVYKASGLNLTPMKVEGIAFFCVSLGLLFFLFKYAGEGLALLTVAIIGVSPYFWDFKDTVVSEFPFLAFCYATLLIAQRWAGRRDSMSREMTMGLIAGLLAGLAYGTRSVGLILIPTILVCDLIPARRPTWFSAAMVLSFGLMAVALKVLFQLESDYLTPYQQVASVRSLLGSPIYYVKCFAVLWDNGRSLWLQYAVYGLLGLGALVGGWVRLREKWSSNEVFTVFYFLFISLFPWGGRRYLMPIMPFFVYYLLVGLRSLVAGRAPGVRGATYGAVAAMIIATFLAKFSTLDWREIPRGTQTAEAREMVEFVGTKMGGHGPVVFPKPRFLALETGTTATDVFAVKDPDQALRHYQTTGVSHVIVSTVFNNEDEALLARLVTERPGSFEKLFDNRSFLVYKLR